LIGEPGRCAARALIGLGVVAAGLAGLLGSARAQAFEFVALGDMPYGNDAIAGPAYRHLIELINRERPPFAIHVGDFKDGSAKCTDAVYERQAAYFQRFERALVYTPGDNDWYDCQRQGGDPLERLQALRERFFAAPKSLGRQPIAVQRQSDLMPAFARYRENLRWTHQGVVFATFHTVGPDNGSGAASAALRDEHRAREAANEAWIRAAFALAGERNARALVLASQAEAIRYLDGRRRPLIREGFEGSHARTLLPLAEAAPFPVLLVHGDEHRFKADRPFENAQGRPIANLWRLEVFGEPQVHAVKVTVDPGQSPPFRFAPIWNAMSPDPRQ
jgi:hypothetical protein